MRKREPFPMTDEEVIREALKTVTEYSNRNPGDTFNVNVCVERTLASVHRVWREARKYSFHQALKWEDQVEFTDLVHRITDDLRARAFAKANECLKNRKIHEINKAAANALISYELHQRGFSYSFEWQKLRVKVSIKLERGKALTFIVKYKDIREGRLPKILDEVFAVIEPLNKSDSILSIWPLTGFWKNWTGWQE